jgi:glucosyl-3-phosphoglycerate synthase
MSGFDEALRWSRERSYRPADFGDDRLWREHKPTISVCVPAREEARTIGAIVETLVALREHGLVDEVVVVDASSADGTAAIAAAGGATVHDQEALLPDRGPVLGKGDAMWRALSVLGGDIVCFLDADSENVDAGLFARALVGPLLGEPAVQFVKASYRRPFKAGGIVTPEGGGRVNELTARPLLARFYPQLAAVRQPLAGELAARRELLERIPFMTGYGVEIGLLIDAHRTVGLDGLAQVDLGVRQNRHQSLSDLGPMAAAVLAAVSRRLTEEGRLHDVDASDAFLRWDGERAHPAVAGIVERPPLASLMPRPRGAPGEAPPPGEGRAGPLASR